MYSIKSLLVRWEIEPVNKISWNQHKQNCFILSNATVFIQRHPLEMFCLLSFVFQQNNKMHLLRTKPWPKEITVYKNTTSLYKSLHGRSKNRRGQQDQSVSIGMWHFFLFFERQETVKCKNILLIHAMFKLSSLQRLNKTQAFPLWSFNIRNNITSIKNNTFTVSAYILFIHIIFNFLNFVLAVISFISPYAVFIHESVVGLYWVSQWAMCPCLCSRL